MTQSQEPDRQSAPARTVGVVGLFVAPEPLLEAARRLRDAGLRDWDCHHALPRSRPGPCDGPAAVDHGLYHHRGRVRGLGVAVLMTGGPERLAVPDPDRRQAALQLAGVRSRLFELFVCSSRRSRTFAALLFLCKLGRWHSPLHDSGVMRRITCDRFAIVLRDDRAEAGPAAADRARQILARGRLPPRSSPCSTGRWQRRAIRRRQAPRRWAGLAGRLYEKLKRSYPRWSPTAYRGGDHPAARAGGGDPAGVGGPAVHRVPERHGRSAQGQAAGHDRPAVRPSPCPVERAPAAGTASSDGSTYAHGLQWAMSRQTPSGVGRAAEEPRRADAAQRPPWANRGTNIYCFACHGSRGDGAGPATGVNPLSPPRPSLPHRPGGRLRGRDHLPHRHEGHGQDAAPTADKLNQQDRWKVIPLRGGRLQLAQREGDANER